MTYKIDKEIWVTYKGYKLYLSGVPVERIILTAEHFYSVEIKRNISNFSEGQDISHLYSIIELKFEIINGEVKHHTYHIPIYSFLYEDEEFYSIAAAEVLGKHRGLFGYEKNQ